MKTRKPIKSEKIDLNLLNSHLENLDLNNIDNLNFWLYCKIAMNSALRSSDILEMEVSNIDFKNMIIRVIEKKTKKENIIPFKRPQILERINQEQKFVLWNPKYKTNVSLMTINRRLKTIFGSSAHISSHSIRKSVANEVYINSGKDIYCVMKFLNHSSVVITQKYLGLNQEQRNEMFNQLNY
jgi:integrase